jgi:cobalt-zinc-cadmium efflux system protein
LVQYHATDVNLTSLREPIGAVNGVAEVHDLHVWSLISGVNALSVHTVLADHGLHDEVLAAIEKKVTSEFKIGHATLQVECKGCAPYETHL